jgi:hypothetical protein
MTEKTPEPAKTEAGKPKATTAARALPPPVTDPPDAPSPAGKRDLVPVLYLAGFVVLAAAIIWLWQNPPVAPPPPPPGPSPEVAQLRDQLTAVESRLTRLEQRPAPAAPPPPDLAPLTARVAALEARKPPPPVDLAPIEASIADLEKKPPGDPSLGPRVEALSGRVDALATKADALTTREDALSGRVEATDGALGKRLDAVEARLAPLEKNAGQITTLADRSARIARIQAAQAALDSGIKLGDLPGAPPALAHYAGAPPPTEASLRLSFPAAAQAALAASKPNVDDKPFLDRAWAKAQDLVTLRQGDHVIVGDPAAGVLARARADLDAGDLAGAVSALGALTGPGAAAMADWKAQAQGLLDARRALADMAAHA